MEHLRDEVCSHHVLRHLDALQSCAPTDAGAVGKDEIARVERVPVGRIGGGEIQRMGIDEEDADRPLAAASDGVFQQVDGPSAREVVNAYAQNGESGQFRLCGRFGPFSLHDCGF